MGGDHDDDQGGSGADWLAGYAGWPAGLRGSVNLTIPLTTWLGLTLEPGEAAGLGALDAGTCRDLASALAANPASRWCLTITDAAGHAVSHGCARTAPAPPGPRPATTGRTSPAPPGTGPPAGRPARAGPPGPRPSTTGPASSGQPRPGPARAGPPGTGPPGGRPARAGPPGPAPPTTEPARASASAAGPPGTGPPAGRTARAGPPGTGPPGDDVRTWLARIQLTPLEKEPCSHQRESSGYRPSASLRHLINIRDRICFFPPCRRQATKCDQDHTVAYDKGGRTCECNIGPGCRHHHKAKQAPGWHLDQPQPGQFTWTMPNGRQITTTPGQYPVS